MRIACPTCSAAYEVPDSVLSSGIRRLRCARCGHEWSPQMPEPVAVVEPPAAPRPAPPPAPTPEPPAAAVPVAEPPPKPRRVTVPPEPSKAAPTPPAPAVAAPEPLVAEAPLVPVAPPRSRTAQLGLVAAWVVSFAVLAAAGTAGIIYRERVATVWPPSQRLYAALGLTSQTR